MREKFLRRLRAHPAAAFLPAILFFVAAILSAEGFYRLTLSVQARAGSRPGVFELYAVGDSSMLGLPFYISPPDIVSMLFSGRFAGRELRVLNLAEGGNSMYTQALKAIRTLKYRDKKNPAVVLIYGGHAENISVLSRRRPLFLRLCETFKRRILLHSLLFSKIVFSLERTFLFYGIRDLDHYEFYLRKTIEAALEAGALPVIATLGSNIEQEPSVNNYNVQAAGVVSKGVKSELRGDYAKALAQYTGLYEGLSPADYLRPYLAYRIGRCLEFTGDAAAARGRFLEVLENDPFPLRAKPSQNAIIRRLAGEYSIPLVDAEKMFADHSAGGFPGEALFMDLMHPNAAGYLLLARAFADRLATLFRDTIRSDIHDPAVIFDSPGGDSLSRAAPYLSAGACLLWYGQSAVPVPDCLKLAEKNFRTAMSLSGGDYRARIGLRISVLSKKNRYVIPEEVYNWFQTKRRHYVFRSPMSNEEYEEADAFLAGWEKP